MGHVLELYLDGLQFERPQLFVVTQRFRLGDPLGGRRVDIVAVYLNS